VQNAANNGYVADISNKSKAALTTVGGAVTGATYSIFGALKTFIVEEEEQQVESIKKEQEVLPANNNIQEELKDDDQRDSQEIVKNIMGQWHELDCMQIIH